MLHASLVRRTTLPRTIWPRLIPLEGLWLVALVGCGGAYHEVKWISVARLLSQLKPSNPDQFSRRAPFNFALRTNYGMKYGYVYAADSSERTSAYHTAFKLRRRAFDASAN